MATVDGFTGAELVEEIAELVKFDAAKTDVQTRILRAISYAQLKMFAFHDWPELVNFDGSIVTDGSNSYDLTATVSAKSLGDTFGRIVPGTVRNGIDFLNETSHAQMVKADPSYSGSQKVSDWALQKRKAFWLYPVGASDGDTITFDWIRLPVEITYTTAAADITFEPWNHQLIIEGALCPLMRSKGSPDWMQQKQFFEQALKDYRTKSKTIKRGSQVIIPRIV